MKPSGFSPRARWDRHIPETENNQPDSNTINEKIEVLAYFKAGKISPRSFLWKQREYAIKGIVYNWQERQGQEIINFFSVNTGNDLYQISFNNSTYAWRLNKLIT